jgi:hypothetical protein
VRNTVQFVICGVELIMPIAPPPPAAALSWNTHESTIELDAER